MHLLSIPNSTLGMETFQTIHKKHSVSDNKKTFVKKKQEWIWILKYVNEKSTELNSHTWTARSETTCRLWCNPYGFYLSFNTSQFLTTENSSLSSMPSLSRSLSSHTLNTQTSLLSPNNWNIIQYWSDDTGSHDLEAFVNKKLSQLSHMTWACYDSIKNSSDLINSTFELIVGYSN